jgi:hypothetical protein
LLNDELELERQSWPGNRTGRPKRQDGGQKRKTFTDEVHDTRALVRTDLENTLPITSFKFKLLSLWLVKNDAQRLKFRLDNAKRDSVQSIDKKLYFIIINT